MPCPIARSLERVGEWWSILILREAFYGLTRFDEFQKSLAIAPNILTRRLNALVKAGLLKRRRYSQRPPRYEYRLTEKGRDLWSVLTALRLWGDKWIYGPGKEPLIVRDRDRGAVVAQLLPADADGNMLDPRRLVALAGPGTSRDVAARYRRPAR